MRWLRRARGRITGFSTPLGGVSFEPAVDDTEVVRGLIAFLEDRRVLYEPTEVEIAEHCITSVMDIRRRLTEVLARGGLAKDLQDRIGAMRRSATRFAERIGADSADPSDFFIVRGSRVSGLADWRLNQALGELRGVFGIHLAALAARYGIKIGSPLDSILPAID